MIENTKQSKALVKTAVISRFRSDSKTVEITETELRGLIFWAAIGIERMGGGSYYSTIEFINDNYNLMSNNKKKYKKLVFGSRIKNGL